MANKTGTFINDLAALRKAWNALPMTNETQRGHQRFGQFVVNSDRMTGRIPNPWPEVFYAENYQTAYELLYQHALSLDNEVTVHFDDLFDAVIAFQYDLVKASRAHLVDMFNFMFGKNTGHAEHRIIVYDCFGQLHHTDTINKAIKWAKEQYPSAQVSQTVTIADCGRDGLEFWKKVTNLSEVLKTRCRVLEGDPLTFEWEE